MTTRTTDALIIGAGPAGLAAAERIAAGGLSVLLVDENVRVGGQIDRQRFTGPESELDRVPPGVTFLARTQCLGFLDDNTVALNESALGSIVRSRATVIATGGLERAYPVPGWTKSGVMTVGAAQTFVKGSGTFPYRRVLLAGTGPLLLAAASQLLRAGVEVAAIIESARLGVKNAGSALRVLSGGSILLEGTGYIADIIRHRTPVHLGHAVTSIESDAGGVTGVTIVRTGHGPSEPAINGRTDRGRFIACDAVLMSQGFNSANDLCAQLGVALAWNPLMQTWAPVRDDSFRTSVESVWAIGDCAGIGGSKVAALEGTIAGNAVAAALGGRPESQLTDRVTGRLLRRLRALDRFRRGMDEMFSVDASILELATPDTIACRCQSVTVDEVRQATLTGAPTVHGAKLWTRAGMGICQGRSCGHIVDSIVTSAAGSPADMGTHSRSRSRFPIRPVSARLLTEVAELYDHPTR